MNASDEELLAAVAGGDREAFAEIYRRRRPDVYRFAVHMTGSASAAEDVTQDVFITVIHEARRYDPRRAAAVSWLLGIARNHARRRTTERPTDALSEAAGKTPSADASALDGLVRAQQIDSVRRALFTLPATYREVIVLCDLQELSYADAAAALGCALGTVRSRLHRGRAMLAERLRVAPRMVGRWPTRDWVL